VPRRQCRVLVWGLLLRVLEEVQVHPVHLPLRIAHRHLQVGSKDAEENRRQEGEGPTETGTGIQKTMTGRRNMGTITDGINPIKDTIVTTIVHPPEAAVGHADGQATKTASKSNKAGDVESLQHPTTSFPHRNIFNMSTNPISYFEQVKKKSG